MYVKPRLERYGTFRELTRAGFNWCFFTGTCGTSSVTAPEENGSTTQEYDPQYDRS